MKTYEEIFAESNRQQDIYRNMYSDFYDQRDRAFAARLEERKQHQEKKMALAANAMGMISVAEQKLREQKTMGDTLARVYAWLDYCGSLPHQMFDDSSAGERIKKNFDTLWDLYAAEAIDVPFTHWLDDTNPSWLDVPETWPTNSSNGKA